VFPEYVFNPPVAETYLETLQNGIPVFIVEDGELPLIEVVATFKGGSYLDGSDRVGLTPMMASLIRGGGTTSVTAEDLDEQFAFLAASVGVGGGGTSVTASLDCLALNFRDSFALFVDMLKNPGFQESRLTLQKDNSIENMKQRNDHPKSILRREYSFQMFGDSYLGRKPTQESIESITRENLILRYEQIVNPANLILSVSGDFEKEQMLAMLNRTLGKWDDGSKNPAPPSVSSSYKPGVYYVDQDGPQGGVRIGTRTVKRDDPDIAAFRVMNYILGGGGFSSRITQTVRSDEGLAYGVGSRFSAGTWSRGTWGAAYESKNSTVALAAVLIFNEIERIKTILVSEEELALAKSALIEQFPSTFQSKSATLGVFVDDMMTNRERGYWGAYRDNIGSVTAEDVMRVANRILSPEEMVVVVVGDWNTIKGGDVDGRATMEDVRTIVGGEIVELPLRDPLTLEVLGK
jgi:predicted Zn-dependent peptidase